MNETELIFQDPTTGLFGFRLEMGRSADGARVQARRTGYSTERAALIEYRRLSRKRDAQLAKPRLTGSVQAPCESWLQARQQELEPNTLYNYTWLLSLIYPYVGRLRASRLTARAVQRVYRNLETAGYSRSTLRTLDLVLSKAFGEQTGLTLGTRRPRDSDAPRTVWTLAEARRFLEHVQADRLYPLRRQSVDHGCGDDVVTEDFAPTVGRGIGQLPQSVDAMMAGGADSGPQDRHHQAPVGTCPEGLEPDHDDHPCRDERANAVASGVLARHCQTHSSIPATTGTGGRRRGQVSTCEQREKPQIWTKNRETRSSARRAKHSWHRRSSTPNPGVGVWSTMSCTYGPIGPGDCT
jgi:hypothetical protein